MTFIKIENAIGRLYLAGARDMELRHMDNGMSYLSVDGQPIPAFRDGTTYVLKEAKVQDLADDLELVHAQ